MATIKFTTNLPLNSDPNWSKPWLFDPKYFDSIPDKPGVYIVGVKIPVSDPPQLFDSSGNPIKNSEAVEKFCPLYVGIKKNIRERLIDHHNWNGYLNGKKELFDLEQSICNVYEDIFLWNKHWDKESKHSNINVKTELYSEIAKENNTLIWFPHESFFNHYLKLSQSQYVEHTGHFGSVGDGKDLDTIKTKESSNLKEKIITIKKIIFNQYWYAYVKLDDIVQQVLKDENHKLFSIAKSYNETKYYGNGNVKGEGRKLCENFESLTKELLSKKLNIHTYATSGNCHGFFQIDLTDIKDDLVNMTGKPFPLTSGKFII
ncbi:MAG: hypothetical protein SNJ71_07575 [Bacteroidales bacterium]